MESTNLLKTLEKTKKNCRAQYLGSGGTELGECSGDLGWWWWLGPVGGLLVTWAHWGYQVLLEREAFVRIGNLMMMMVVMMMTMFLQNNSWFSAGFWYTSEHKKAGAPKSLEVDDSDGFFFSGCVLQVKVRRSWHREEWSSRWVPSLTPKVFWKRSKWCLESWETSQGIPALHQCQWIFWPLGISVGIFVSKTRNMIGTSH